MVCFEYEHVYTEKKKQYKLHFKIFYTEVIFSSFQRQRRITNEYTDIRKGTKRTQTQATNINVFICLCSVHCCLLGANGWTKGKKTSV